MSAARSCEVILTERLAVYLFAMVNARGYLADADFHWLAANVPVIPQLPAVGAQQPKIFMRFDPGDRQG
jgi:hypothetical protein